MVLSGGAVGVETLYAFVVIPVILVIPIWPAVGAVTAVEALVTTLVRVVRILNSMGRFYNLTGPFVGIFLNNGFWP